MPVRSTEVDRRARAVRAIVLDVDGVLTDARLYYGPRGEALKAFLARDGFAIKLAQREGLVVGLLSGRVAAPVRARCRDLGIPARLVIQGSSEKAGDLKRLARRLGLELAEIAFVGDDLPDLPALVLAGLAACPADATAEVIARCHYVCAAPGGRGAVREVITRVLEAQGRWQRCVEAAVSGTLRVAASDSRRSKGGRRGERA
ncbi:MAG: 3-deoxy-D-manno-octulosonate 8-phosphate phosphatase [Acidobacteria bacterium]|jgi:3-deoxy-D-manno-octulosonate 8-phosphate phosphatase (KDO 8-P phosphatase)|nr:3-deoxy-D-manno-octulosonate 8-phosphate phosphatase [Acidobacteriota bacterium]